MIGKDVPRDSSSMVICSITLLTALLFMSSVNSEFILAKRNDFVLGESRHSLHKKASRKFKLKHDSSSEAPSFMI